MKVKTRHTEIVQVRLDGLKVLVVEDELSAWEAFMEMLTSFGAVVKTAASAREALHVFQQLKPDILVSDISMTDKDGYSLIRKIRALKLAQGGSVPAVAVTAHAGAEDFQRALAAGFQFHLAKPVDSVALANVISTVAARSRAP